MLTAVDPYILTFSALTVIATIWMGFRSAKQSKTASDFFVAGRSVSVGWNASAISGEYLSAASFMGIAGMVMSSGYDALWYPVCYACGYLFLLLFIAGPLRRFGAYTIPDFAEGRFDSPLFRKIAVVFVLFIGFFYTMPQMKGAGTTLAYIFPGLPYWAGVVLVGAVITLNVALGGMKGITLVQAFQYWAKMFAISVPIFVLMAVYGHYGNQLGTNGDADWDERKGRPVVITNGINFVHDTNPAILTRLPLPEKAPADSTWLSPFGPLTTKAAKAAAAALTNRPAAPSIPLRADLLPTYHITVNLNNLTLTQAVAIYTDITGRRPAPSTNAIADLDDALGGRLSEWKVIKRAPEPDSGVRVHADGVYTPIEVKEAVELFFKTNGFSVSLVGEKSFQLVATDPAKSGSKSEIRNPQSAINQGLLTSAATIQKEWLAKHEKPLALLYTYSLIIALVCGTAGLPHILVRFYTNPDGVAAKRTTMWVMILIGVFYVFPPVFGVMGRNLLPSLYSGAGAKGTDKVVLELPRILNAHSPTDSLTQSPRQAVSRRVGERVSENRRIPWGSILSGITCAGAFAAFMSTFSGLLVSMTGALAHDVYGRMLRPKATPEQRLRMFKIAAVLIGTVAVVLGCFVEPLEINFMVGQAFAIAAASYFPLLFMSVWWRGMTMKGAATGMLTGGLCALFAVTLTNFSNLALDKGPMGKLFAGFAPLNGFWASHPLLRILCEQPAIWTVPLALLLMVVVSKLTSAHVPGDIRMKMLVLHAPEQLGLKQEYIQEHQQPHH
jgi:cation/acetate symporter